MGGDTSKLILVSASPRRRALLTGAGLSPAVSPVNIDETPLTGEDPLQFVQRMAREKAMAAPAPETETVLVAGDTIVVLDDRILGKPKTPSDARAMLTALSGRRHAVITAWAIRAGDELRHGYQTSTVEFLTLTAEQVEGYVASGEPMDKAGAYGIQGLGGQLVKRFDGDFSNIVGLPLRDVLSELQALGLGPSTDIGLRLAALRGRIAAAAEECGRDPSTIRLVGASKGQQVDSLLAAYDEGLRDFGESYVQEWQQKRRVVPDDVRWHFIGRLQTKKARLVCPAIGESAIDTLHTVDSVKLADSLGRRAVASQREIECLLQVNLGGESTKSGAAPEEVPMLLKHASSVSGLTITGLMTLPPKGGLSETRAWFRTLRELRDSLATPQQPLPELSMGMSGDLDAAVVEGSTMVRVGTALFGPRPPRP